MLTLRLGSSGRLCFLGGALLIPLLFSSFSVMLNTSTPIAATAIAAGALFRTLCRSLIDLVL